MIFNEVYGNYYNAVAEILSEAVDGNLNKAAINRIASTKAFGESAINIPESLLSKKWPLIDENFGTPIVNKPTMPLTDIQKMWLKGLLSDPRIQLFEPSMEGLEDVEPLFDNGTFVYFDRYTDGDPFEDEIYKKHFRQVLGGLKEKRKLRIEFNGKNSRQVQIIIPEKLEYSPKDDKFRLLGVATNGLPYIINIVTIISCEVGERFDETEHKKCEARKEMVVFKLIDERNALERVMLHFSDLEKETTKITENHYIVKLKYYKNDETEILIRILSFGPMVKVVEPVSFVELIKERILNQKSCEF